MDDLVYLLRHPSIATALLGQRWVDEHYDSGSREHRRYSGVVLLFERYNRAWWTYYHLYILPELLPEVSTEGVTQERIETLERIMKAIWEDLGAAE